MDISEEYKEQHGFTPEKIADTMMAFYEKIDALSTRIESQLAEHGMKLTCHAGCCACCRDELTVTRAEAAVIRKLFPTIGKEKPHAPGACAFLDDRGLCRIYAARPYVCRTHGLPLHLSIPRDEAIELGMINPEDVPEDAEIEFRSICELNHEHIDVEALPNGMVLSSEIAETQLGLMELCTFGEEKRIPMRSFFLSDT